MTAIANGGLRKMFQLCAELMRQGKNDAALEVADAAAKWAPASDLYMSALNSRDKEAAARSFDGFFHGFNEARAIVEKHGGSLL